jgi:phosphate transport system substrate-binding protein
MEIKMKRKILTLIIMILYFGIILFCTKNIDEKPLKLYREHVDIWEYIPFYARNRLAVLNKESSLKIYENVPRLDGATALYPIYASFAQAVYPPAENYSSNSSPGGVVKCTTTAKAFENLINGEVNIIFTFAPSQNQIAIATEKGVTFTLTPIGKDAFVFLVNKNNQINNLTTEQIRGIYSGNITNWMVVGGRNEDILAYQRPPNSGSQTALESIMLGIPIMEPPPNRFAASMNRIIENVEGYQNNGNAIGYSFLFFTTEMVNNEIKLLTIDGVMPTNETIQSGEYPFSVNFYAITTGNETENTRNFIEWILSEDGQYLIEQTGYVPIR